MMVAMTASASRPVLLPSVGGTRWHQKMALPRQPRAIRGAQVNKESAGACEILAGALKDNKRAVLFGEPTFGKGKIESVFELSDGFRLASCYGGSL